MAEPPILTVKNTSLSFGNTMLFSGVELYINQGDKISLIGRNGSGKSTLLKIISGNIEPDEGEKFIQPGIKIAYMPQDPDFEGCKTLRDVILSGLPKKGESMEYKADILVTQLKILENQPVEKASGGELRKASLAKALVNDPDILLLDEPTNHLDIEAIETLEGIIREFKGAVVIISHDRAFLNNVSKAMFWLDRGILRRSNKSFAFFEKWQDQVIEEEILEHQKLKKKLQEETDWLHKGVTARRKRNMGRLRRLQELREQRRTQLKQVGNVKLGAEVDDFRSKLVAQAKHISISFGERMIVKDFSTRIIKGNKIGIVGPNGAGKTTLVKLLTGKLTPDSGHVRIGKNLEEAYFDQNRMSLNPKKTLWKTLCDEGDHIYVRGNYRHVVAYLKDFLFKPEQAQQPVAALSGGEKNRLMLAVALAKKSNFIVLDEPTNDLDMDTLDLLQEVLFDYEGTVIVVSHDRDFIDKVVTSTIYMPGDGSVIENAGSYSDLMAKLKGKPVKPEAKVVKTTAVLPVEVSRGDENKKKLSYKQQRLLEVLPIEIAKMEKEINGIEVELMDANLYLNDPTRFDFLTARLEELKISVEEKELTWLEISEG